MTNFYATRQFDWRVRCTAPTLAWSISCSFCDLPNAASVCVLCIPPRGTFDARGSVRIPQSISKTSSGDMSRTRWNSPLLCLFNPIWPPIWRRAVYLSLLRCEDHRNLQSWRRFTNLVSEMPQIPETYDRRPKRASKPKVRTGCVTCK